MLLQKALSSPIFQLAADFTDTRTAQFLQACMDHSHQNSTGGCTQHWQWEPLGSAALHWTGLLSVKYHLKHHYQQFSSSLVLAWQNPPELLWCESATHVHTDVTEPCLRQWGSRVRNLFSWDIICPPHTLEGICKSMWPEAKLLSPESISAVICATEQTWWASIVHIAEKNPQNISVVRPGTIFNNQHRKQKND